MTKKESNDHGQKLWRKTAFPATKFGKAISGGVNSFFDTLSSLSQPVVSQISSIQTKQKTDNYQQLATFQQLRINEELIASWSCDDDVPFALIKECTTSLMHPSSEASPGSRGSRKRFPKQCVSSPQKKDVTRNFGVVADFFLTSYLFLRTLFVCHQKIKQPWWSFPKKTTQLFFVGGGAFGCLPHHPHRDSSAFFRWQLSPRHGN